MLTSYADDEVLYPVSLDIIIEVLQHMPSNAMDGHTWEDQRVREALTRMKGGPLNIPTAYLNVRRGRHSGGLDLVRQDPPFQGFAAGDWIIKARNQQPNAPVLVVMMEKGEKSGKWDNQRVYVPTLVLPKSKFAIMFNYS